MLSAKWANAKRTAILAEIDGISMLVPCDADNVERQLVAVWEAEGGVIAEYEPQAPAPIVEIHAAWLRAALAEPGTDKLGAVNAAVASQGPVKLALWEFATTIRIGDANVVAIAGALNIDLRALFDRADEMRRSRP